MKLAEVESWGAKKYILVVAVTWEGQAKVGKESLIEQTNESFLFPLGMCQGDCLTVYL